MWNVLVMLLAPMFLWGLAARVHGTKVHHQETLRGLVENYPALSVLGGRLVDSGRSSRVVDVPRFSADELRGMRFLLRSAYLSDDMPVKQILDGAALPDLNTIANLNFVKVLQLVHSDPSLMRGFAEQYSAYAARQQNRHEAMRVLSQTETPTGELLEETLYEECAKDYDSFVAPITNPLTNVMVPECDGTDSAKVPSCRNETLPDVPQYRQGRRSKYTQCDCLADWS